MAKNSKRKQAPTPETKPEPKADEPHWRVTESDEERVQRQAQERMGLFTLRGAAATIAQKYGWHKGAEDTLVRQLLAAAKAGALTVRHPHTNIPYSPDVYREFYELVNVTDLDAWFASKRTTLSLGDSGRPQTSPTTAQDNAPAIDRGDQKLSSKAVRDNYPGKKQTVNWRWVFDNRNRNGFADCLVDPTKSGDRTCWKSRVECWLIEKGYYPIGAFNAHTGTGAQSAPPATVKPEGQAGTLDDINKSWRTTSRRVHKIDDTEPE